jgi:catechol 2,3-dioxygenase-like lactoylglutathione lyase family enzyme
MIEGISVVILAAHEMPRAVRFYRALGFEVLHGTRTDFAQLIHPANDERSAAVRTGQCRLS